MVIKTALITLRPEYKLGGQTESIINLAAKLKKKELKINVIDPLNSDLLDCDQIQEHKSCHEVTISKFFSVLKLFNSVILNSDNFDILQIHLPTPAFSILGDILKLLTGKKIILVFEGHLIKFKFRKFIKDCFTDLSFYFIRYLINNKLTSSISFKLCDKYVVSTKFQKKELLNLGYKKSKIEIIPNCTDIEKYTDFSCDSTQFDNLPIKNNLIIYIGHFWDTKGVTSLIQSFKFVIKEKPEIKLVLAWSGLGDIEKINKIINDNNLENNVIIIGKIKVQNLLCRAQLLILPYKYSFSTVMFPNLILEAFTVGIPIISTNLEPIKEIVVPDKTGYLAEPVNPENLAEQIIKTVNLPQNKLNEIINNQKHAIKTIYNPENIADKFISIYKEVLNVN